MDIEISPTKNFTPRQNPPKSAAQPQPVPVEAIDWTDKVALRNLALERLVEILQTSPRNVSLIPAIRELLDRVDGKPAGSQPQINIGGNGEPMTVKVILVGAGNAPKESIKIIDN